jgi:hypothetical protein
MGYSRTNITPGTQTGERAMNDGAILAYARDQFARVHNRLDDLSGGLQELKQLLTAVELRIVEARADLSGMSGRLDRLDGTLGRIERRLGSAVA